MLKNTLSCILLVLSCMLVAMQTNSNSWDKLNEITWNGANGWGGHGYTFYKNNQGQQRYCYQIYGSGVQVVSEENGNVAIKNDTILLSIVDIATAKSYPTGSFVFKGGSKLVSLDKQVTLVSAKEVKLYYKEKNRKGFKNISELKNK